MVSQAPARFLFLYLKTGGGHLAPARAVRDWTLEHHAGRVDIALHDGFEGAPGVLRRVVEEGYSKSQAYGQWAFELLYALHKIRPFARLSSALVSLLVRPALERVVREQQPDKIVIFHFFLIRPVRVILRRLGRDIPVLTVVTDPFTAHPIWFLEPNQHFVVFSQELKGCLAQRGWVDPARVSVFPFVLNPRFDAPRNTRKARRVSQMLGLDPNLKTILVMGGADGIPKGERLLRNLHRVQPEANIVLVCGRNTALLRNALSMKMELNFWQLRVVGYVDYVRELLALADVVITKCGASTFMEILISGKVPLINSYIWEQEKGNVEFIRRHGMGLYEPNPRLLAQLAREIIGNEQFSRSFRENIARMGLRNGTPQVSEFIMGF